ncbi:putative quinol monooxygenase [Rickettsiales bacterium LUAb2]
MNNSVLCIAQFTAKNGKANELKEALQALVEPTRKEIGCISYTLHEAQYNDNTFVVVENFKDMEAFNLHSNSTYITKFKNEVGNLIADNGVSVNLYKPL